MDYRIQKKKLFIEYAKTIGVRYQALSGDDVAKEELN